MPCYLRVTVPELFPDTEEASSSSLLGSTTHPQFFGFSCSKVAADYWTVFAS